MITKFTEYIKENKNLYNNIIDYTYLKPNSTYELINNVVDTAIENKYYAICILPKWVSYAKGLIEESKLKIVSVCDFPNGDSKLLDKLKEVNNIISDGADEIDIVANYKLLKKIKPLTPNEDKEKIYKLLEEELKEISYLCHKNGIVLKVIIETGLLTYDEIKLMCEYCINAGVDYIKTSTGVNGTGAELDKVKFIRKMIPDWMKIKASGGIRTIEDVKKFLPYVDRIGTSVKL